MLRQQLELAVEILARQLHLQFGCAYGKAKISGVKRRDELSKRDGLPLANRELRQHAVDLERHVDRLPSLHPSYELVHGRRAELLRHDHLAGRID